MKKRTESALGETLKTLSPRKKEYIRVCDCGTPMIWTFFFPFCERFCLNCGRKGGMLGTGDSVPATRELIFKKRLVDAIWKELYSNKGMLPGGDYTRSNCKKCRDEKHWQHLSKAEKEWDAVATPFLKRFEGLFD